MADKENLTPRKLNALKPAAPGKRRMVWDGLLPNFGVRIGDKADSKGRATQVSFIVMRRVDGKLARYKVGEWDREEKDGAAEHSEPNTATIENQNRPITLAEARDIARGILADMGRGIHPKAKQLAEREAKKRRDAEKRQRERNTFAAVAEAFIADHVETLRSAKIMESIIRRELIGRWGERQIVEISRADVVQMVSEIARDRKEAARQALAHCRNLFSWALETEVYGLEASPCAGKKVLSKKLGNPTKRARVLKDDELRIVWEATRWALGAPNGMGYPFGPFVRMLILTGQRLREVAEMQWSEIEGLDHPGPDRALWTIPVERMKGGVAHEVPLSRAACELLRSLPRGSQGDFVFSTLSGEKPISGFSKAKARIDREIVKQGVDLPPWVFHDLRRTVRTALGALRVGPDIAELVIAHARPGLHQVYDLHSYEVEKRHALELWASKLLSIIEPSLVENVVELRAATK